MGCNGDNSGLDTIGKYTSPVLTIGVPVDLRDANVYVTFKQNGKVVLEKTNDEITIESNKIVVPLTQEDTSHFVRGFLSFQIRYVFIDGTISSDKTSFVCLRMSNLYGTGVTDNSDVGGYVYKIVGYYD